MVQLRFFDILRDDEAVAAMKDIGVDIMSLVDFADLIFEEPRVTKDSDTEAQDFRISFDDLVKQILQLRGSNTATVKDMVDLRWWFSQSLQSKVDASVERMLSSKSQLCVQKHTPGLLSGLS